MDLEVMIHYLQGMEYGEIDRLTEKQISDLKSGLFHTLAVAERVGFARIKQARSGQKAYRGSNDAS
jgi:hypothetical protein